MVIKNQNQEVQSWIEYLDQSFGHPGDTPFSDSSWGTFQSTDKDEELREQIALALYLDPHIDASFIQIEVSRGEVILMGKVFSQKERLEASKVVENTEGVWSLQNDLMVISTSSHPT